MLLSSCPNLDSLGSDLLVRCASYLDANGMAQLGRTSTIFGIPQAGHQNSLVNEAAHEIFWQSATDEERNCLPEYDDESDIGLYRALEQLRKPLCFRELVGNGFSPQEHPARVTWPARGRYDSSDISSTAMSGHVMRGGRHFVEFAITYHSHEPLYFVHVGVIRPVS